jgi:hypothetical protein
MYCRQPFKKFIKVTQLRCLQSAGLSIMVLTVEVSTGTNILLRLFKLLLLVLEDQECLPFADFSLKIILGTQQGCRTFFFGELTGKYVVRRIFVLIITQSLLDLLQPSFKHGIKNFYAWNDDFRVPSYDREPSLLRSSSNMNCLRCDCGQERDSLEPAGPVKAEAIVDLERCVLRGEAKLVEVKGPRDRLSEQQRAWIASLLNAGLAVQVCKVLESLD